MESLLFVSWPELAAGTLPSEFLKKLMVWAVKVAASLLLENN